MSKAAQDERAAVAAWVRGLAYVSRGSGEGGAERMALLLSLARRVEDGEHMTEAGRKTARVWRVAGVERGWEVFS